MSNTRQEDEDPVLTAEKLLLSFFFYFASGAHRNIFPRIPLRTYPRQVTVVSKITPFLFSII